MFEIDFMEFEEVYILSVYEVESMMFYICILDMIKYEELFEMYDLVFLLFVYLLSEYEGVLDFVYYYVDVFIKFIDGKEVKSLL